MSNDITVRIKADAGPLKRGMNDGERAVKGFSQSSEEMARKVARAGAVVVTAVAAIGAGVLKMASEAAQAGVEIRNLAATAGTSTTNFQKMADATRTVGVEQDKLSDILKDVNDKFGDYMATGAGPLADFFENIAPKIGITAEAFANLSGPDALQLYVSSLEQAGLSQQQMTFYMEALASDATRLLPLLRDNGSEMRRLGDEAQAAGRVMSEATIAGAVELDRELANLANTLKANATTAVIDHKDEIIILVDFITNDLIPAVAKLAGVLGRAAEGWRIIGRAAEDAIGPLARAAGLLPQTAFANTESAENAAARAADVAATNAMGGGDVSATGTGYIDANGNWVEYGTGAATPTQPGINAPVLEMTPATGFTGEGGLLPEKSPGEIARAAWEAQQELQEEIEEGTQTHQDRLTEIAELAEEQRLARVRDVMMQEQALRSQTADMAIGLLSNLGKKSEVFAKAAVALNAAKAIGETIQNTAAASVRALAELGPIAGPPAAARISAFGKIQAGIIATNAALSLGGGSGGGGGSASTVSSAGSGGGADAGGGASPTTTFSFTLQNDPMGFGESFARQMIEQLNEAQRNGSNIRGVLA